MLEKQAIIEEEEEEFHRHQQQLDELEIFVVVEKMKTIVKITLKERKNSKEPEVSKQNLERERESWLEKNSLSYSLIRQILNKK